MSVPMSIHKLLKLQQIIIYLFDIINLTLAHMSQGILLDFCCNKIKFSQQTGRLMLMYCITLINC